jgi:fructose-1,6-bisphosphatase/inositol monophosphatase family enzyme
MACRSPARRWVSKSPAVSEVAAIYDPTRRELFTAERAGGAYLNGARLQVSGASAVIEALLVTGFPYDVHEDADEVLGLFGEFVRHARAVRRLGSAALDMAYVAAGRFDGFWEDHLHPWDVAAASLLVEEAGGVVSGTDGSPFLVRSGHVLATTPGLQGPMLETISAFRDRRAPKPDALIPAKDSRRRMARDFHDRPPIPPGIRCAESSVRCAHWRGP